MFTILYVFHFLQSFIDRIIITRRIYKQPVHKDIHTMIYTFIYIYRIISKLYIVIHLHKWIQIDVCVNNTKFLTWVFIVRAWWSSCHPSPQLVAIVTVNNLFSQNDLSKNNRLFLRLLIYYCWFNVLRLGIFQI